MNNLDYILNIVNSMLQKLQILLCSSEEYWFFLKQVVNLDELKSQNSLSCFRGSSPFSSVLWAHACMAGELASDLGRASRIRCFLSPWHFLFLYFLHLTFCQLRLPHTLYFSCSSQQDYWCYLIILTVLHSADGACPQNKATKTWDTHPELLLSPRCWSPSSFGQLWLTLQSLVGFLLLQNV